MMTPSATTRLGMIALGLLMDSSVASAQPRPVGVIAANAAAKAPLPEYENRARRLSAILCYTSWEGSDDSSPLVLGIFGELEDRALFERALQQRGLPHSLRIITVSNADEAKSCHVLYLPNANGFERRSLLSALDGLPVLTIGEFRRADWPSCMIEFVRPPAPAAAPGRPASLRIELSLPSDRKGISFKAPLLDYVARNASTAP